MFQHNEYRKDYSLQYCSEKNEQDIQQSTKDFIGISIIIVWVMILAIII